MGLADQERDMVLQMYRKIMDEPRAMLGHAGRWYDKGKGPVLTVHFKTDRMLQVAWFNPLSQRPQSKLCHPISTVSTP
jgi:hypothetical protein